MRESENKLNAAASSNASEASQSMMQSVESQEKALEELRKVWQSFLNNSTDLKPELLPKGLQSSKKLRRNFLRN